MGRTVCGKQESTQWILLPGWYTRADDHALIRRGDSQAVEYCLAPSLLYLSRLGISSCTSLQTATIVVKADFFHADFFFLFKFIFSSCIALHFCIWDLETWRAWSPLLLVPGIYMTLLREPGGLIFFEFSSLSGNSAYICKSAHRDIIFRLYSWCKLALIWPKWPGLVQLSADSMSCLPKLTIYREH